MLLSWMGYATLVGALVYAAAAAADRAAATWGMSRRAIWALALLVATVSPAILAVRPSRVVAAPARVEAPATSADRSVAELIIIPSASPRQTVRARVQHDLALIDPYVGRAWLIASLAWLMLLLRAAIAVRRQRAQWTAAEVDGVPVLVAANVGPAVVGAINPRVVIPQWALSLDASVRGLMLHHEAEHIRARDPMLFVVALLAAAAFPWNVAVWMIVRRLRLAIEIDCDRRVLRVFARQREYGELLLIVGARYSAPIPFATSLAERRPFLERRIRAMTTTMPRHPRLISAVCITLVVAATSAAVRAPRPASLIQRPQTAIEARQPRAAVPSDSLSVAEIRALIAAHHPGALVGDPGANTITLVVDANGDYVVSAAEGRPPVSDGGGRVGRSGGAGAAAASNAGQGRARGGSSSGTADDSVTQARPRIVQRMEIRAWNPVQGVISTTRLKSLVTLAGDTMVLSTRYSKGAAATTADSERVFTLINSNMRGTDVINLNTTVLSHLVEPERVESIRARTFDAGELGVTALHVFVVHLKP